MINDRIWYWKFLNTKDDAALRLLKYLIKNSYQDIFQIFLLQVESLKTQLIKL